MRRLKFRNVKELYDSSSEVLKPEVLPIFERRLIGKQCPSIDTSASKCSSWLLSEELTSSMEMKRDDGISNENCKQRLAIECSPGDIDGPSSVGSACHGRPNSCSETSYILGACSSRDSFSENEDSKGDDRAVNVSEMDKLKIISACQKLLKTNVTPPLSGNHKCSIQHQKQKDLDYSGDNISSISYFECADNSAGDLNCHNEKKSASCCSASDESTCGIEKSIDDQSAFCYLDRGHDAAAGNSHCASLIKLPNKAEVSEISSLRVSSYAVSVLKGEHPEPLEEQVESSLTRRVTFTDHLDDANDHLKIVQLVDEMAEKKENREAAKCSDGKAKFENVVAVDECNVEKPLLQFLPQNCAHGGQNLEDEVRVCDICGDVGWERQLIACSKCNDGAEHIYCMRVKTDKVSAGNWMCELCMLEDETEKQEHENERTLMLNASSLVKLGNAHSLYSNKTLDSDVKASNFKETEKIAAKRPLDASATAHDTKRRALETQRSFSYLRKDCSSDKWNTKSSRKGFLFRSKSFNDTHMKSKVQSPKQVFKHDNAAGNGINKGPTKLLSKSTSFKNTTSGANVTDFKITKFCSKPSDVDSLDRLKHENGGIVRGKDSRQKLDNNLMRTPASDKFTPSSVADKQIPVDRDNSYDKSNDRSKLSMGPTYTGVKADKDRISIDARQGAMHSMEATSHTKGRNLVTKSSSEQVEGPFQAFVPQPEYVWRGGLMIQRSGRPLAVCNGFQAHLSEHVSPKVTELAHKLPQKIFLEQLPRTDIWPTQFLENQVTEDSIALYFFARDMESYKTSYKSLLDSMIKNDFALKGEVDGIDLLIYPSVLLPEKSRRWNKLLYLWGVFRGKKLSLSNINWPQDTNNISSSNVELFASHQSGTSLPVKSITSSQMPTPAFQGSTETRDNERSSQQDSLDSQSPDEKLGVVVTPESAQLLKGSTKTDDDDRSSQQDFLDSQSFDEKLGVVVTPKSAQLLKGSTKTHDDERSSQLDSLDPQSSDEKLGVAATPKSAQLLKGSTKTHDDRRSSPQDSLDAQCSDEKLVVVVAPKIAQLLKGSTKTSDDERSSRKDSLDARSSDEKLGVVATPKSAQLLKGSTETRDDERSSRKDSLDAQSSNEKLGVVVTPKSAQLLKGSTKTHDDERSSQQDSLDARSSDENLGVVVTPKSAQLLKVSSKTRDDERSSQQESLDLQSSDEKLGVVVTPKSAQLLKGSTKTRDDKRSSQQDSLDLQSSDEKLGVVVTPKTSQLLEEVSNNDNSESVDRDLKRGIEIDLNKVVDDIDDMEFQDQSKCKRLKSSLEISEHGSSGGVRSSGHMFLFGIKVEKDTISDDDKRFAGVGNNSMVNADPHPMKDGIMTKSTYWQASDRYTNLLESGSHFLQNGDVSGSGISCFASKIPNHELPLVTGEKLPQGIDLPLLSRTDGGSVDCCLYSSLPDVKECSTSLSLSLALPFDLKEESVLRSGEKQFLRWKEVDTCLSLHGGLGNM